MGKLSKKLEALSGGFEEMMSAVTFAEAGEHETARQMQKGGSVLLVLREAESGKGLQAPRKGLQALKFALNISKRIGAGLEVLYVSARKEMTDILGSIEEMAGKEGVSLKVQRASGCVKREIVSYTEKRRDIKFVVIESSETLDIDCGDDKRLSQGWDNLKCPLVVVSEQA